MATDTAPAWQAPSMHTLRETGRLAVLALVVVPALGQARMAWVVARVAAVVVVAAVMVVVAMAVWGNGRSIYAATSKRRCGSYEACCAPWDSWTHALPPATRALTRLAARVER